ncbi:MAG TPA: 4Fe-4S ferredoxin, partial [Runella sp.]|nr:4Fe-4S ferredoxin [Runella sp.]
MKTYFEHINDGIRTTLGGLKLTFRHLWQARNRRSNHNVGTSGYFNEQEGMVTLQYPLEVMPIPDNGRYRLHNEMDDCIVCDKCAKVCPVDCIDIEPIKATGEVGKASDGSPIRLYAAKFDIDMAKCCYCGLCTTVCPTECLTMTKTFDYSEFDVRDMNYHYANLSPEEADEKKTLYEQFMREKEELKKQKANPVSTVDSPPTTEEKSNSQSIVDSPQTTEENQNATAPI